MGPAAPHLVEGHLHGHEDARRAPDDEEERDDLALAAEPGEALERRGEGALAEGNHLAAPPRARPCCPVGGQQALGERRHHEQQGEEAQQEVEGDRVREHRDVAREQRPERAQDSREEAFRRLSAMRCRAPPIEVGGNPEGENAEADQRLRRLLEKGIHDEGRARRRRRRGARRDSPRCGRGARRRVASGGARTPRRRSGRGRAPPRRPRTCRAARSCRRRSAAPTTRPGPGCRRPGSCSAGGSWRATGRNKPSWAMGR